uniref:Putative ovule protein n=1 Tax=Solanum chacoense TaxID=4108 RepID=A0A0V0GRL9_SOLCH
MKNSYNFYNQILIIRFLIRGEEKTLFGIPKKGASRRVTMYVCSTSLASTSHRKESLTSCDQRIRHDQDK